MKEFILDNYLAIILVISFFIFALIGYLIDASRREARKEMETPDDFVNPDAVVPDVQEVVAEPDITDPIVEVTPEPEVAPEVVGPEVVNEPVVPEAAPVVEPEVVEEAPEPKDN